MARVTVSIDRRIGLENGLTRGGSRRNPNNSGLLESFRCGRGELQLRREQRPGGLLYLCV